MCGFGVLAEKTRPPLESRFLDQPSTQSTPKYPRCTHPPRHGSDTAEVLVKCSCSCSYLCLRESPPSHMISHSSPRRSSSRDGSSILGMSFGHDFRSFRKLASSSIGAELVPSAPSEATGGALLLLLVVLSLALFALREEDIGR